MYKYISKLHPFTVSNQTTHFPNSSIAKKKEIQMNEQTGGPSLYLKLLIKLIAIT